MFSVWFDAEPTFSPAPVAVPVSVTGVAESSVSAWTLQISCG